MIFIFSSFGAGRMPANFGLTRWIRIGRYPPYFISDLTNIICRTVSVHGSATTSLPRKTHSSYLFELAIEMTKKLVNIRVQWDEQDMVTQKVHMIDSKTNKLAKEFYVCRFYGSKECWIETTILHPKMAKWLRNYPLKCRDLEAEDGSLHQIVSVNWLLDLCPPDAPERAWLEGVSTVFDKPFKDGEEFYHHKGP